MEGYAIGFVIGLACGFAAGRRQKSWSEMTTGEKNLTIAGIAIVAVLVVITIAIWLVPSWLGGR